MPADLYVKAHPHCKSPAQIGGAARPSGLMSVDLAGRLVSSALKHFFQRPADFPIFSVAIFFTSPSHHNHGTLQFEIAMSKFPKMFDEGSISRIQGPCNDCDWGERGVMKITSNIFENFKFSKLLMKEIG